MRTIPRPFACRQPRRTPAPPPDDLITWARSVIADPASHHATDRDTAIVADLLGQLKVA